LAAYYFIHVTFAPLGEADGGSAEEQPPKE